MSKNENHFLPFPSPDLLPLPSILPPPLYTLQDLNQRIEQSQTQACI